MLLLLAKLLNPNSPLENRPEIPVFPSPSYTSGLIWGKG